MHVLWFGILTGLVMYACAALTLYWFQGRLIYPGELRTRRGALEVDLRFVWLSVLTADGLALVCRYCPAADENALTVLLLHGNGEDLQQRSLIAERLADEGYGVLQAEYRGFAGNPGRPSENGLYADGRAAMAILESTGHPIIIHGFSLGTGVAVQLAAERSCAGLILEAPFTSVVAVAKKHLGWLPLRLLVRDHYDNLAKIARINLPVLIYGGDKDRVIPPSHFEQLHRAARYSRLVLLEGAGHTDAWEAGGEQHVLAFMRQIDGRTLQLERQSSETPD